MDQAITRKALSLALAGVLALAAQADAASTLSNSKLETYVPRRVAELQPKKAEKRFDEVGWAGSLVEGKKLAAESGRPVFVFTHDGRINIGRC